MRVPISWLREYVDLPPELTARQLAEVFTRAGLQVELIDEVGSQISGPLVVGRILRFVDEPQKNGKVIRWVQVDVGSEHNQPHADFPQGCREVVCGAHNFVVGDLVVVSLPGTTLAGGFKIAARKTYGHVSDGMICAEDELGIGNDHAGIIILSELDDDANPLCPGDDPSAALYLRDEVLDIDVSPDMGYCLSVRGLAREAAQGLGLAFRDPVTLSTPAAQNDGYRVVLSDSSCPLFVGVSVDQIDPAAKTPRWMARRLVMCGMRSISLAVDITNYVMLEIGQPLHGYDRDLLQGAIVVRKANPAEKLTTLDGVERILHQDDLLITDDSGAIGMAGVMGGQTTELSDSTVNILLEAAYFDPAVIGWTLRRHNLPSEASKRFHRGVDPAAAYAAAHRAAELLVQLGGGELVAAQTIAGAVPAMPTQQIPADLPSRILGLEIATEKVVSILTASGVDVALDSASAQSLCLVPPTWRPDLVDPYDYVEEVGRKIGFDALPALRLPAPMGRGLTKAQRLRRAVNAAVAAAGFTQVITFPFMSAEDLTHLEVPASDIRSRLVRLANPLAETAPFLRTTLLPGLSAAALRNMSRGNDDLAIFETGSIFLAKEDVSAPLPGVAGRPSDAELAAIAAAIPEQPEHLAALVAGDWRRASWQEPAQKSGWQQVFALADIVCGAVGAKVERVASDYAGFHPGRCAALQVSGVRIGYAGELHPNTIAALRLPVGAAAVEINLSTLFTLAPDRGVIPQLSSHPIAKEDLAVVVAADVNAGEVEAALREGAGELLEDIWLFDVFTGGEALEGKKSLAFALRFRAADRTLTDAETAHAKESALALANERFAAVLRSW